jgi:hypothetical protein
MTPDAVVAQLTPFDTLLQLAGGSVLPRCLTAVANLGIADALDESPQSGATLAAATGAHPAALDRVLRLLSAYGIFEHCDGRYSHTPASRLLRTDHPQSTRPLVRMLGLPAFWASIGELEQSVLTGSPAMDIVLPEGVWNYFSSHPDESRVFNEAMTAKAHGHIAGVVGTYDFTRFGLIGDIGGGRGHLLQAVLARTPVARGVLFDLPHVIQATDVTSDRITLQAGDFFKDPLPTCDAYLIMEVLHDWDDEQACAILRSVRSAAPAHAKLLVVEVIVPDEPGPSWAKTLDIWMLVIGGKQRTRREYEELLSRAGFCFIREIDTGAGTSIIEAAPV